MRIGRPATDLPLPCGSVKRYQTSMPCTMPTEKTTAAAISSGRAPWTAQNTIEVGHAAWQTVTPVRRASAVGRFHGAEPVIFRATVLRG
jgi:hypothetical protein